MWQKFSFKRFLQNQDAYQQPLALAYRQNKTFPTVCGGVLTIFHALFVVAWLTISAWNLREPSWTVSSQVKTGLDEQNQTPEYYAGTNLLPTIRLDSIDQEILPLANMSKYFTVLYSQENAELEQTYYPSVNCKQTQEYDRFEIAKDTWCPQYESWINLYLKSNQYSYRYKLVAWVAHCESAEYILNTTMDCVSLNESQEMMQYLSFQTNTYTSLPNPDFIMGIDGPKAIMHNYLQVLMLNDVYPTVEVDVLPQQTTYSTNWFKNVLNNTVYYNFKIASQSVVYLPKIGAVEEWQNGTFFSMVYRLNTSLEDLTYLRADFMDSLVSFSAINGLAILITASLFGPYISFSTDLALSEELYTVKKKIESAKVSNLQNQSGPKNEEENIDKLTYRVPFSYPLRTQICDWIKSSLFCCCSCCSCCQQSKLSNQFTNARSLLYSESDLLQMIRHQRLASFLSSGHLKPHHYSMQRWFKSYTLRNEVDSDSDSDDQSEKIGDNPMNVEPSAQELAILDRIQSAKEMSGSYSRSQWFEFREWLEEQSLRIKLYRIIAEYNPSENHLDLLSLGRVRGKDVKDFSQDDIRILTDEFKGMLQSNISLIEDKEKNYSFIKLIEKAQSTQKSEMNQRNLKMTIGDQSEQLLGGNVSVGIGVGIQENDYEEEA